MKIGIIGSGYVGLVTGNCFAHLGHTVICVDKDKKKIAALKKGQPPIYEPGLEEMIHENLKHKRISFTTQIKTAIKYCEVLFICVNTPPKPRGEADLSFVEAVAREIAENLTSYRLIVEKSTVPVQTGEWVTKTIKLIQPKTSLFDVASNPEFLREGSAVHDFLNPDRVVVGVSSKKSEKILRSLYEPFNSKLVVTDLKSAELIKHASNSFLAVKISFINTVARVCDAAGADVEQVARGMGLDPRIGASFLRAGIGFGGFCFPKDLAAFLSMSEKLGVNFDLLRSALKHNDDQKDFFLKKIEGVLWNLQGKKIGILGISFKPDTDDIRFAPSLDIIKGLQKEGVKVVAYDPEAMTKAKESNEINNVEFAKNAYGVAEKADAIAVLTEWDEFKTLDFKRIKKLMKTPIIFDGRNMYDPASLKKLGFKYFGIGRNECRKDELI